MIRQIVLLALFASAAIGRSIHVQSVPQATNFHTLDHVGWVAESLKRMQTIRPGMTREDLLKVFTTEGGLSTGLRRTYVSQDCPYFKVDVEFEAVGRPNQDADGRVTLVEDARDVIVNISRPYLQFSHMD